MNLRQLQNFIRVVELGSITAAAERLHIAQPALSRQVKALEDRLKVPLLRRHGRGVIPTEEGIRLARRAQEIIDEVEALADEISGKDAPLSGILTLGLPPTVAEIFATHLIERSMAVYPDVKLRIISGFSGHIQDWLLRGKIDIGVAYEEQKAAAIDSRPIILEKMFLIQPALTGGRLNDVPVTAQEALTQQLILPTSEHGLRGRIEAVAQAEGIDLDVTLEVDMLSTMLAFVERGLGSTILPLVSVMHLVRDGRLIARPIIQREISRTLILMKPQNQSGSRLKTAFADFLAAEVHAMVKTGQWPGTTL